MPLSPPEKILVIFGSPPRTCAQRINKLEMSFELTSSSAPGMEKLRNGGVRPCTNWKIFLSLFSHSTRCRCSIFTLYLHCSKAESPTTTYRGSLSSTMKFDMASETRDITKFVTGTKECIHTAVHYVLWHSPNVNYNF